MTDPPRGPAILVYPSSVFIAHPLRRRNTEATKPVRLAGKEDRYVPREEGSDNTVIKRLA